MWTEPKTIECVFYGWGNVHPVELARAASEERERKRYALLEDLDGLMHSVSAPRQLRAALEPLASGTHVRIEYLGFKPGSAVKMFIVTATQGVQHDSASHQPRVE